MKKAEWSASTGISGPHQPESLVHIDRNHWSTSTGLRISVTACSVQVEKKASKAEKTEADLTPPPTKLPTKDEQPIGLNTSNPADSGATNTQNSDSVVSQVGKSVAFSCSEQKADLEKKGVVKVNIGKTSFFVGYVQASSLNKNPVMARFDEDKQTWCRNDFETSNDDGGGYGLLWDGKDALYAVFSSTGTQGTESTDFRRYAKSGWYPSYGAGGGAKIIVVAKIAVSTGEPTHATFLRAQNSSGNANSIEATGLKWSNNQLTVEANSWFSPVQKDKKPYNCDGGKSPFQYSVKLDSMLSQAVETTASAPCK